MYCIRLQVASFRNSLFTMYFSGLVFLLLATGSLSENSRPRLELPIARPEIIESYKLFLKSILTPEGIARRNLLIAIGIIPHPPEFHSQRHFYETVSLDSDLSSEIYEHVERHVIGILDSKERFDESLNALFGERLPLEESTEDSRSSIYSQTKEPTKFSKLAKDDSVTKDSMDDSIEVATLKYVAADEFEDASTENESEIVSPSVSTDNPPERDETSTHNSLVTENTVETKPTSVYVDFMAAFESLLAESLLLHDHGTASATDKVSEYATEADDRSPQTVPSVMPEDVNFVTIEYDSSRLYTTTESPIGDESKVSSETSAKYLTTEPLSTMTPTLEEIESDVSNLEEPDISEHLQSLQIQTIPIADIQLIDKVIPISADEYKYSIEKNTLNVELIDIHESPSNQMETEFPNVLEETEKLTHTTETGKQIKKEENAAIRDELQRQIHKFRGIPGKHFPNYEDFPDTSFACHSKKHIPGFYADQESNCQVFHVCWPFRRETFLCPSGTTFNQAILACDHWYNSNCSLSQAYFDVNLAFDESESSKAGTVGPMVETLLKASETDCPIRTEVLSSSKDISKLYIADVHFSESIANEELSHIWKFLPVKAKIFIYPEPKFMDAVRTVMLEAKRAKLESELIASKVEKEENKSNFQTVLKDEKQNRGIKSVNLGILRELSLQKELEVNSV